ASHPGQRAERELPAQLGEFVCQLAHTLGLAANLLADLVHGERAVALVCDPKVARGGRERPAREPHSLDRAPDIVLRCVSASQDLSHCQLLPRSAAPYSAGGPPAVRAGRSAAMRSRGSVGRALRPGGRTRPEHGQRSRLHDCPYIGRKAQIAARVHHAELALGTILPEEGPGPFDDRAEAVAEAVDEREVDERPHDPAREPAEADAFELHDRAEAPDRRRAAEVAVMEGLARLAVESPHDR